MKSITTYCSNYYLGLLCGILTAGCLTSCSEDMVDMQSTPPVAPGRMPTFVTSPVDSDKNPGTRVTGGKWEANDQVGIYMVPHVEDATAKANLNFYAATASNVPYQVSGGGSGSASLQVVTDNNAILYPNNGREVNFVAYYPYQPGITDNIYKVNISKQSRAADIDLYYYKGTGTPYSQYTGTDEVVALNFTHQLSKIQITLNTSNLNVAGTEVSLTLEGFPSTADFNLSTGTFSTLGGIEVQLVPVKCNVSQESSVYEALLIPHNNIDDSFIRRMIFICGGENYSYTLPDAHEFLAGKLYTYQLQVVVP